MQSLVDLQPSSCSIFIRLQVLYLPKVHSANSGALVCRRKHSLLDRGYGLRFDQPSLSSIICLLLPFITNFKPALDKPLYYLAQRWFVFSVEITIPAVLRQSSFFISVVVDALSSSLNVLATFLLVDNSVTASPLPVNPNSQPASKAHRSSATRYSQPTRLRFGLFKNGRCKLREPGDSRDTNLLPRLSNGKSLTLDTRHRGRRIDDAFYELLPLELPHSYFDRKNSARLNVLSNIDQLSRITGIDIYNDKSYNRAAVWFLHSRMSKPLGSGEFQTILEEIGNQMDRLKPPAASSETGQAQSHSSTASGDDLTTFIPYHPTDPPNHPHLPIPAASSSYEH
ncbi:hypothetical protein FB446DRAFT_704882 [Lentinula raphanica]|nr:hypothetical protein FB446DRAFT_704882 [Lentinula raphanica]